jgi:hypothetical protein
MHKIGTHMKTDVVHADGTTQTIFDKPFSFGSETHYYQDYVLMPGESLKTSCSSTIPATSAYRSVSRATRRCATSSRSRGRRTRCRTARRACSACPTPAGDTRQFEPERPAEADQKTACSESGARRFSCAPSLGATCGCKCRRKEIILIEANRNCRGTKIGPGSWRAHNWLAQLRISSVLTFCQRKNLCGARVRQLEARLHGVQLRAA